MYFLLYWIQNLREAGLVGSERPADLSLACSRWWEEGLTWGQYVYVQTSLLSLQPSGPPRQFFRGLQVTHQKSSCLSCLAELEKTSHHATRGSASPLAMRNHCMYIEKATRKQQQHNTRPPPQPALQNSLAKAVYSSHEMRKSSDSYIFLQDNWRNCDNWHQYPTYVT